MLHNLVSTVPSDTSHIPTVRLKDRTFVHYIEVIDSIPLHVTMELDISKNLISKSAIPLAKIFE